MKKMVIMIGILGLFSMGFAQDISKTHKTVKIPVATKHLSQRYTMLKNKKIAWTKRKKILIQKFKELYESADFLGKENRYGKLRLERHQKQFYTSIKEKDDEIETNLREITRKLTKAKKSYPYLSQR